MGKDVEQKRIKKKVKWKIDFYKGAIVYVIFSYLLILFLKLIPKFYYPDLVLFFVLGSILAIWVKKFPILEIIETLIFVFIINILPMLNKANYLNANYIFYMYSKDVFCIFFGAILGLFFYNYIIKYVKIDQSRKKILNYSCKFNTKFGKLILNSTFIAISLNIILICFTPTLIISNNQYLIVPVFFLASLILGSITGQNCYYWLVITIASQIFYPYVTINNILSNLYTTLNILFGYFLIMICGSETGRRYIFKHLMKNFYTFEYK